MHLLINILAGLFILFGIGLLFSQARGAYLASVICIGSGAYSYDEKSFLPLVIGFGFLWVMRISGIEKR